MSINNISILLPLLCFDYDYYIRVIVISRYKDTGNEITWRRSFFGTKKSLEDQLPEIIDLANKNKARVYVDLTPYRLSTYFLAENEWKFNKVFGVKEQLDKTYSVQRYGLFDADSNSVDINSIVNKYIEDNNIWRLIIKSSENGEHWILKMQDIFKIKNELNLIQCSHRMHTDMVWTCLYNPIDTIKENLC